MHEPRTKPEPVEVFISYSSKDEALMEELTTALAGLIREGVIKNPWRGPVITAGANWEEEIDNHINRAEVILLLVSPDFIASDYCYGVEFRKAEDRAETGEARVIPIILRPCHWSGLLGKFQALPVGGRAVTLWENRDQAFVDIATGLQKAVKEFTSPSEQTKAQLTAQDHTKQSITTVIIALTLFLLISGAAFFIFASRFFDRPRASEVEAGGPPSTLSSLTPPHAASPTPNPTAVKQNSPTDGLATPVARATVRITVIPPSDSVGGPDSDASIAGEVSVVPPGDYRVVVYALTVNVWWVQPTTADPLTKIGAGGKWEAKTHRGTRYAALLVPADFNPPGQTPTLPTRQEGVLASFEVEGKKK
jgi:hypothetical protein